MKRKPTILVIDDSREGQDLIRTLLSSEEYDHEQAFNGTTGLRLTRSLKPDLILLDVRLPDIDGIEICRRIRQESDLAEIPIILITAHDEPEARQRGIEAGADDFLTKPFDHSELQARVRSITRLNRYRRLLAERERFQWVVEESEDAFLILNENDEILAANPQATLFLGLPADLKSPAKITFLEAARKEYRLEPGEAWNDWPMSIDSPTGSRYLIRPQTASSRAFWLEVTTLKQTAGESSNLIIRLRDVTEEKKSLCRIHSFEASISQKLRNRLLEIVSTVNTLARKDVELDTTEFKALFQHVVNNTRVLEIELVDILKYLEAPGLLYADTGFEFKQLALLLEQISEGLGIKPPRIIMPEELNDLQTIISDLAMEAILGELLQNAKKFHPARLPNVEVTLDRYGDLFIKMQIADNGLTLSPEQIKRAWTPYYQGDSALSGETEGMGLGLPMIASFIWHWGGRCRLHNRIDGPGVVVELLLPINERKRKTGRSNDHDQ